MTQPTPGPWRVGYDPDAFAPRILIIPDKGTAVAEVWFEDRYFSTTKTDEALANARLMAAAPKMLAALRKVMATAMYGQFMADVVDALADAAEDDRQP